MTRATAFVALLFALIVAPAARGQGAIEELGSDRTSRLHAFAVFGPPDVRRTAVAEIVEAGDRSAISTLILALRYRQDGQEHTIRALQALTGSKAETWFDAMLWQERHPEVVPHPSYRHIKLALYERIDPAFRRFLSGERGRRDAMDIRLEEIVWGGVRVDGIPSLDNPDLVAADHEDAAYLLDSDLVFGVEIEGDARAYPLRILGWHEMFNDVIGGVPVALAYCTLCGAGILYETRVEGRDTPFRFGSSGFLYRSNKLMFDRETDSLWNQFTGEPVSGPLRGSGIALTVRPVTIASWSDWRRANPDTRVLTLHTGHERDYGSGVVYRDYFASPDLMFPASTATAGGLSAKDYVYGIRTAGGSRAWPLTAFADARVINDSVGLSEVVLIGDPGTRTVRAFHRDGRTFAATDRAGVVRDDTGDWLVGEDALVGPDGERLPRLPGHVAYWFAWNSYLGAESSVYGVSD